MLDFGCKLNLTSRMGKGEGEREREQAKKKNGVTLY